MGVLQTLYKRIDLKLQIKMSRQSCNPTFQSTVFELPFGTVPSRIRTLDCANDTKQKPFQETPSHTPCEDFLGLPSKEIKENIQIEKPEHLSLKNELCGNDSRRTRSVHGRNLRSAVSAKAIIEKAEKAKLMNHVYQESMLNLEKKIQEERAQKQMEQQKEREIADLVQKESLKKQEQEKKEAQQKKAVFLQELNSQLNLQNQVKLQAKQSEKLWQPSSVGLSLQLFSSRASNTRATPLLPMSSKNQSDPHNNGEEQTQPQNLNETSTELKNQGAKTGGQAIEWRQAQLLDREHKAQEKQVYLFTLNETLQQKAREKALKENQEENEPVGTGNSLINAKSKRQSRRPNPRPSSHKIAPRLPTEEHSMYQSKVRQVRELEKQLRESCYYQSKNKQPGDKVNNYQSQIPAYKAQNSTAAEKEIAKRLSNLEENNRALIMQITRQITREKTECDLQRAEINQYPILKTGKSTKILGATKRF